MTRTRAFPLTLAFLCVVSLALAQDTLVCGDGEGAAGETGSVLISLSGATDNSVAGVNGTLTYDSTILTEPIVVLPQALTAAHTVESNVPTPGELRFVIYADPTATFAGVEGPIAAVNFTVAPGAPAGPTALTWSDVPADPMLNGTAVADDTGAGVAVAQTDGTFTVVASDFPLVNDFEASDGGWVFTAILPTLPSPQPSGSWGSGALNIQAAGNTGDFAFWNSPSDLVPVVPGSLYRAAFTLTTTEADQTLVPDIRLRSGSSNRQLSYGFQMGSEGSAAIMPTNTDKDYNLLFTPPAAAVSGDTFELSFDLVGFKPQDSASAMIELQNVQVMRFDEATVRAGLSPSGVSYDFAADPQGWTFDGFDLAAGTAPTGSNIPGAVQIEIGGNLGNFGNWTSPEGPAIAADTIYATDWTLSTDIADRTTVPDVRLRASEAGFQQIGYVQIISQGDSLESPDATPSDTPLYLWPDAATAGSNLAFAFDLVGFEPTNTAVGTLRLENLNVLSGSAALLTP